MLSFQCLIFQVSLFSLAMDPHPLCRELAHPIWAGFLQRLSQELQENIMFLLLEAIKSECTDVTACVHFCQLLPHTLGALGPETQVFFFFVLTQLDFFSKI